MSNQSLVLEHALLTTGGDDHLLDQLLYAINHATEIEIAVSFIQPSGLYLILPALQEAIARQSELGYPLKLKILTSDYLHITHPTALRSLVELVGEDREVKIFETHNHSFHLKSYIFVRTDESNSFFQGSAFIGSNNISKTALTDAHEWCLRYDYQEPKGSIEAKQFNNIREKFTAIFNHQNAKELTDEWINYYIKIRQKPTFQLVTSNGIVDDEVITPNSAQQEALIALDGTRQQGFVRGLVVLGTGMGKTWLAAFDAKQLDASRVLFVAHREEILSQALNTFAQIWPEKTSGFYHGKLKQNHKQMLFASVQTLGRESNLTQFSKEHFDYIVIDEFHHASAKTYLNIINYFMPKFMLGLTATPERTDQANILSLCHDNLVFERNLVHGIDEKILVPFHYYGVWDQFVNYQEIPWRNGKFDPTTLDAEFATIKRAQHIFKHWKIHQQSRTLAFCISTKHADFMAKEFNREFSTQGLKAVSVHSQSSIRRNEALTQLDKGEVHVVFSVDLFNEGTDLPSIDTVLMLRPTESNIIFLQQLGRGLRLHQNKSHLVVIDFIGNHKSFLNKQELLGIELNSQARLKTANNSIDPKIDEECYINIEPQITDFWQKLIKQYRHTAEEDYLNLEAHLGHKPNATEFYRAGYDLAKVNKQHLSWFGLVATQSNDKKLISTIAQFHDFLLYGVQTTSMTKSFKAILLEAFIELDGFRTPPTVALLAQKSWYILSQYPFLKATELPLTIQNLASSDTKWLTYWRKNPIHFSTTIDKKTNIAWFVVVNDIFKVNFHLDEEQIEILHHLVKELIDFRLAKYIDKKQQSQAKKLSQEKSKTHQDNVIKLNYYHDLKIACGHFKIANHEHNEQVSLYNTNLSADKHFIAQASGNSMNGGKGAILDGDLLLLEIVSPVSAGSITGNTMVIEIQDEAGDNQYLLRNIQKRSDGTYWLIANNPEYQPIPANETMRTFARLKQVLSEEEFVR